MRFLKRLYKLLLINKFKCTHLYKEDEIVRKLFKINLFYHHYINKYNVYI